MIQPGQLASLIKEHVISPVTHTSNANPLKTALGAFEYVRSSVELRQTWKEGQVREALLELIELDGAYSRIIKCGTGQDFTT